MDKHPNITARLSAIDAAAWQILRNAVIRALVEPQGRTTLDVNAEEGNRLIEPFQQAMLNDVAIFREQLKQMYLLGVESVQAMLMGQPGVDQEMLDEAITFHSEPRDDDGEALR